MGDNRENSTDSRELGLVKKGAISGEAKILITIKKSEFAIKFI